jgi:hypothetical protein
MRQKGAAGDFHESRPDLERPDRLGAYLRFAQAPMVEAFRQADERALRAQKWYRITTAAAAIAGSAALTLSARNLLWGAGHDWLWVELGSLLLTVLAVAAGIFGSWHGKWLLSRYQAERLRLLKYAYLADETLWRETENVWQGELLRRIQEVGWIRRGTLEEEAEKDDAPGAISRELAAAVSEADRAAISEYYLRKRLETQIAYFSRGVEHGGWWRFENRQLLPTIFFVSISLVGIHLVRELSERRGTEAGAASISAAHGAATAGAGAGAGDEAGETSGPARHGRDIDRWLLLAALGLPAIGAGIRTFRAANEFGRNRARSAARRTELADIARRMQRETSPHAEVLAHVALAESVLAGDQREWLRLMLEAEWYG